MCAELQEWCQSLAAGGCGCECGYGPVQYSERMSGLGVGP